jgi:predicted ATPase/class 3 adenylate cyclase
MVAGTAETSGDRIVGLLFSDIEGSTRLAQRLGAAWLGALEQHRSLARAAFANHHGHEVATEGDSFFVVFGDPLNAVEAAAELQSSLEGGEWPAGGQIRVRIGIHAGPVTARDDGYVGVEVHRAARIAAGGHGRQVLLSEAARAIVGDRLPTTFALRELGRYRLKDFDVPQTVFQLDAPGITRDFPPLRLAALALTNLPPRRTSFVGRAREVAELRQLLTTDRLVTLVGVGGTGKTRLMLEVGAELLDRHRDGVWLVELAAVKDGGLVADEIARTLGVQAEPGRTAADTVTAFLRSKSFLLLVDNCEHLLNASADLVDHLQSTCAGLMVMASSREALGIPGEVVFQVPSLAFPAAVPAPDEHEQGEPGWLDGIMASEAVRLFSERARAVLPSFSVTSANASAVAEICRRLDGIPLAIELAAARMNVLSAEEIAAGLNDRFRLLTGGRRTALPRQQTLQALIDWSWQLLSGADRAFLARLSVFAGGWTLAASTAVADLGGREANAAWTHDRDGDRDAPFRTLDTLSRLVDRSLIHVERERAPRFGMLETIRQYARDRLVEAGGAGTIRDLHLDFFLALALDAAPRLRGPDMLSALERLDPEIDNLRAALEWSFETDPGRALRLSVALAGYWRSRSYGSEAVERLTRAADLALSLTPADPAGRRDQLDLEARVLAAAAYAHALWGRATGAREWAERAVALAREAADSRLLVEALNSRLMVATFSGDFAEVPQLGEETIRLAEANGDWWTVTMNEAGAALGDIAVGDLAAAEARLEKAMHAAELTRNPFALAFAELSRGRLSGFRGQLDEARHWFGAAIRAYEQMGDRRFVLVARSDLGHALRQGGALDEAEALYRETIHGWQHVGNLGAIANQLERFAFIAIARGEANRAAHLLGAAEATRERAEAPMFPIERGEYEPAIERLRGLTDAPALDEAWAMGYRLTTDQAVSLARSGVLQTE